MKELFIMWFKQDGFLDLTHIHGRRELKKFGKQYGFDAKEVINYGETFMFYEEEDAPSNDDHWSDDRICGGAYLKGAIGTSSPSPFGTQPRIFRN